ncbi:methyl-accepting chemotaxis protein [Aureimonas leprariae]|uniref:Methyl-accepting chemotaxis protein n=1 Tax=Plantimonas leprariae TaxID=2615207 RepID=A0A7V7TXL8_9HYPH|nr:methyl-accepting chemotaxis protein [Aureimonas leprariae]KAB0681235.1 methyl-accepting chemotaxis protein [Aureimonas leprariae]
MKSPRLNFGIGTRLFLGFGALLLVLVAMAAHSTGRFAVLKDSFAGFGERAANASEADELASRLLGLRLAVSQLVAVGSDANRRGVDEAYGRVKASLDGVVANASGDPAREAAWKAFRDQIVGGYDRTLKGDAGIEAAQAAADKAGALAGSAVAKVVETVGAMIRRNGEFDDAYAVSVIQDRVLSARMLLRSFIAEGSEDDIFEAQVALRDAERKFDQFRRVETLAGHPLVNDGRKNLTALFTSIKSTRAAVERRTAALVQQRELDAAVDARIAAMRADELARMEDTKRAAGEVADDARRTAMIVAGAALLFGAAVAFLIGRGIVGPVRAMTQAMRRLSDGDLAVEVPGTKRRDEIGGMAGAMQVFRTAAIERRDLAARLEEERLADEAERRRAEAEAAARAIAEERAFVAAKLGAGLKALADGDLTLRLEEAMPGEYERLRADFNDAMASLSDAMAGVAAGAGGIAGGSTEIGQASHDLSRRTEAQAATLEETAAALSAVTQAIRVTSQSAAAAHDAAAAAKRDVDASGLVVGKAIEAMGDIERSSAEIRKIISVIDEIAFQTNLLALNAGVEAARAGESGRGFAVVAQEVRGLAQRSAEAAKEIKGLIATASRGVDSGVTLVAEAGEALSRIAAKVVQVDAMVAGIAESAREQAGGLAGLNDAVGSMDKVTQQNAAMVEETTAASRALMEEARHLTEMIGRFRVVDEVEPAAYARAA